jgi:hypothetical protein
MPCEEVEAKSASILHYSTNVEYFLILKRALAFEAIKRSFSIIKEAVKNNENRCMEKSQVKGIERNCFQAVMAFSCSTLSVPFRPIRSCFSPLNANA